MRTIKRLRAANGVIWLVIIFLGCAITLSQVILDRDKSALIFAFLSVCGWTFWYCFSTWLFGMRRHVARFMQRPIADLTFVDKHISMNRLADVVRAMQEHCEESPSQPLLAMAAGFDLKSLRVSNPTIDDVAWRTVDIDGGKLINIPENAVFFLHIGDQKCIVKATFENNAFDEEEEYSNRKVNPLQLCADTIEQANSLMQWLLARSSQASIFRGHAVQVHAPFGSKSTTVRIVDRPTATRGELVLPDEVLSLAETLLLTRAKHRHRLAGFGHSSRLGLLFYGPPGTGKTLVTKYLLSKLVDHTVIIPTDLEPETLRECFRLAAYLEPTVVIVEDVDLLATNRTQANGRLEGLQELMNEMDGLSSSSDTMVILSTNRPDVLEPALASRPGRVSQAIEFPLPDQQARLRLLELFLTPAHAKELAAGDASELMQSAALDLSSWAARTDRASPAFLQELCKRALLLACNETDSDAIVVTDQIMREAIHQLVVTGGKLNTNVLGFPDAESVGT